MPVYLSTLLDVRPRDSPWVLIVIVVHHVIIKKMRNMSASVYRRVSREHTIIHEAPYRFLDLESFKNLTVNLSTLLFSRTLPPSDRWYIVDRTYYLFIFIKLIITVDFIFLTLFFFSFIITERENTVEGNLYICSCLGFSRRSLRT